MAKATKKKTIMETLTIGELSGVDVPAMEGARSLLLKRHDPNDDDVEKFDLGMQNPRATSEVDGHQHLLDDNGQSGSTTWETSEGEDQSHSHSWIRNSDGEINVLLSEGHDHQLLEKRSSASTTKSGDDPVSGDPKKESTIMDPKTKKAGVEGDAVTQEQLDVEKARADRAEKMAELTDEQKSFYKDLGKSEQESFLQLDADGRQSEVDKSKADDPVVYKDLEGNKYRKSDDQRVVSAVKRADRAEKTAKEERELRKDGELSKRAAKLTFVKGKDEVKVALLKAIDGIEDEDLRKGALEIVAAANSGLQEAFKKRGTAFGADPEAVDAEAKLEKMAQEYQKTNDCTIEKARAEILMTEEGAELANEVSPAQPVID